MECTQPRRLQIEQLQRKPSVMVSQENEKQIALQWQAPV